MHRGPQRGEFLFVEAGQDEQGGTDVEEMPVAHDAGAAPAGEIALLDDGDAQPVADEADGGAEANGAGADDHHPRGVYRELSKSVGAMRPESGASRGML